MISMLGAAAQHNGRNLHWSARISYIKQLWRPLMPNRTTHRSTSGSKLYAERAKSGQFKDVQTYKRAHGQDVKRSSKAERAKKH